MESGPFLTFMEAQPNQSAYTSKDWNKTALCVRINI
jgi:hypothetical protein